MTQAPAAMNGETPDPEDIHCIGCGYNLRSTDVRGTCPECGKSVADSLALDAMSRTDPVWALGMATGVRWMVYYLVGWVACGVLIFGLAMVSQGAQASAQAQNIGTTQPSWHPNPNAPVITVPAVPATPVPPGSLGPATTAPSASTVHGGHTTVTTSTTTHTVSGATTVTHTAVTNATAQQSGVFLPGAPVAPTGAAWVVLIVAGLLREGMVLGMLLLLAFVAERLTRKEPNREGNKRPCETWRMISRVLLPIWLLASLVVTGMQLIQLFSDPLDPAQLLTTPMNASSPLVQIGIMMGFALVSTILWTGMMYGLLKISADVASRIGRKDLESQAKRVVYYYQGILGSIVLMVVITGAAFGIAVSTSSPIALTGTCLACLFVPVVFGLVLVLVIEASIGYVKVAQTVEQQVKAVHPGGV